MKNTRRGFNVVGLYFDLLIIGVLGAIAAGGIARSHKPAQGQVVAQTIHAATINPDSSRTVIIVDQYILGPYEIVFEGHTIASGQAPYPGTTAEK